MFLYVYPYIFCIYLLHVLCVDSMCIKLSRWCPGCVYFICRQKLPHSDNAGLVLYVEYVLPTYNVNEMKQVSAKQGVEYIFSC